MTETLKTDNKQFGTRIPRFLLSLLLIALPLFTGIIQVSASSPALIVTHGAPPTSAYEYDTIGVPFSAAVSGNPSPGVEWQLVTGPVYQWSNTTTGAGTTITQTLPAANNDPNNPVKQTFSASCIVTYTYHNATTGANQPVTLPGSDSVDVIVHPRSLSVQTGSWQPNPAYVGQEITSDVTGSVTPTPAAGAGSVSSNWQWSTGQVWRSDDGTPGTFTPASNYIISWTQGSASTTFHGNFSIAGYYIIQVTGTASYHDDTNNRSLGSYSGIGYIGGSASDVGATTPQAAHATMLRANAGPAPTGPTPTGKGVPVTDPQVDHIEYKVDTGSYQSVTSTLYVLKGTTLTFKAIPNPTTATWTSGKPIWGGTSGASGTGPTTDVIFNTVSNSATDTKTVTAKSGNTITVNIVTVDLAVKQVSLSGTNYHQIVPDPNSTISSYSAPQWLDNNLNGSATDTGDKDYPVCYTRHDKAQINDGPTVSLVLAAVPSVSGTLITSGNVMVKATAVTSNALSMAQQPATVGSGTVTVTNGQMSNLPDKVGITAMQTQWLYSPNGGTNWSNAGVTDHKVYQVLDQPTGGTLYETVVATGCSGASGQNTLIDTIQGVWSMFTPLSLKRISDSTVMQYWGYRTGQDQPGPNPEPADYFTTQGLIYFHDGRCGAWANFMIDVLGAQGIHAQYTTIIPIDSPTFGAHPGYYIKGFVVKSSSAAQGNANPNNKFYDHAVVKILKLTPTSMTLQAAPGTQDPVLSAPLNTVYDPSYGKSYLGTTIKEAEQKWEDNALSQYAFDDNNGTTLYLADPVGSRETQFNP